MPFPLDERAPRQQQLSTAFGDRAHHRGGRGLVRTEFGLVIAMCPLVMGAALVVIVRPGLEPQRGCESQQLIVLWYLQRRATTLQRRHDVHGFLTCVHVWCENKKRRSGKGLQKKFTVKKWGRWREAP